MWIIWLWRDEDRRQIRHTPLINDVYSPAWFEGIHEVRHLHLRSDERGKQFSESRHVIAILLAATLPETPRIPVIDVCALPRSAPDIHESASYRRLFVHVNNIVHRIVLAHTTNIPPCGRSSLHHEHAAVDLDGLPVHIPARIRAEE